MYFSPVQGRFWWTAASSAEGHQDRWVGLLHYRWERWKELTQCQNPLPVSRSLMPPRWQTASQSLSTFHNCRHFLCQVHTSFTGEERIGFPMELVMGSISIVPDQSWFRSPLKTTMANFPLHEPWVLWPRCLPFIPLPLPDIISIFYLKCSAQSDNHWFKTSLGKEGGMLQPLCTVPGLQSKINSTEGNKGENSHYLERNF